MIILTGSGYTAWINEERGGSCVKLERFGADAIRTPSGDADYEKSAFTWGTPLLFPPNRISGAEFTFEDRIYRFPVNEPKTGCFLHGTLHETPFEVVEKCENAVTLLYRATDEEPYLTFPHAFTLRLSYVLDENGLKQTVSIRNDSGQNMPAALAFHTTFRVPFLNGSDPEEVRLTLDTSVEYGRNMANYLPDGTFREVYEGKEELDAGTFRPSCHTISRFFRNSDRHTMELRDDRAGMTVRYRTGADYGYWMVYNGGNKDFLCVEPQTWLSNCPNAPFDRNETGFHYIEPGKSWELETVITIEKD